MTASIDSPTIFFDSGHDIFDMIGISSSSRLFFFCVANKYFWSYSDDPSCSESLGNVCRIFAFLFESYRRCLLCGCRGRDEQGSHKEDYRTHGALRGFPVHTLQKVPKRSDGRRLVSFLMGQSRGHTHVGLGILSIPNIFLFFGLVVGTSLRLVSLGYAAVVFSQREGHHGCTNVCSEWRTSSELERSYCKLGRFLRLSIGAES